jgi:hypothetical protein
MRIYRFFYSFIIMQKGENTMKLGFKVGITLLVWGILTYFTNVIQPGLTREVALTQFENTEASFTNYASWRQFLGYLWIGYLLPLALFIPEAKKGFAKFKNENDSNNQ